MSFINRNVCKTFNLSLNGTKTALPDQLCSEVVVIPHGGTGATIYDHMNPNVGFTVPNHVEFTFRGLTNANQLSATGNGTLQCRSQYFSFLPEVR